MLAYRFHTIARVIMPKRLVTYDDLTSFGIEFSKPTIWKKEREGEFPKRIRPTPKSVAWLEDEIVAFRENQIERAIAQRDAAYSLPVPKSPGRPKMAVRKPEAVP